MYAAYERFMAWEPVSNGRYQEIGTDLSADQQIVLTTTAGLLRAWGVRDASAGRVLLWIDNANHTWRNVVDGAAIPLASGDLAIQGLPQGAYTAEWWNTTTGTVIGSESYTVGEDGRLVLTISNLATDVALKLVRSADSPATPTAMPSNTPLPTNTPYPTATPTPTAMPSNTPLPTSTPYPTATPSPTPEVLVPRFQEPALWLKGFGAAPEAGGWTSQDKYPRFSADVNGDSRADVVGFGQDGVYVSLSTGGGLSSPRRWIAGYGYSGGWTSQDKYPRLLADVNGDGRADVVGFANAGVYVSLSTGGGFSSPRRWIAGYGYSSGWTSQDRYPRLLADVNGDGRADVVGFFAGNIYLSPSTGSGFVPPVLGQSYVYPAGEWSTQSQAPRALADVSGERRADIVGFLSQGVYVALAK